MRTKIQSGNLSALGQEGLAIYEASLKHILEPDHNGEAVAIHVDTGDYAIGQSHSTALTIFCLVTLRTAGLLRLPLDRRPMQISDWAQG